jgi:hypothetical protein
MLKNINEYAKLVVKMLCTPLLCLGVYSSIDATHDKPGQILTTEVEWSTPSSKELQTSDPFSPLWHFNDTTYFIWVDVNGRPQVTSIKAGTATTAPLDTGADYVTQPDGHHRYSMGIDKNGYIHITGDMHNYSYFSTGVITPYPARYQKQSSLYWKSNQPENVTSGFKFVGGLNASTAMPGAGWTIGHFFADNFGELYYTSQVHAIEAGNYPGEMGIGLYKYDASLNTWTALGGLADNTRPGGYYKVVFWDNSGFSPSNWFQGYFCSFSFDSENRLHFATPANTSTTFTGSNRIMYAMSDDGGVTWSKANGHAIPGVPLRGADGQANIADIVVDGGSTTTFSQVGVVGDENGRPCVMYNGTALVWDGTKWATTNAQTFGTMLSANYGFVDKDDHLVLSFGGMAKLLRTQDLVSSSQGYDYPNYGHILYIDAYGLRRNGVIRGIGTTSTNVQSILKTVITEAPLPDGWHAMDIAPTAIPYGGTAGFFNGKFSTTNYGDSLGNTYDRFQFVYKEMTGDGSITARVTPSVSSPQGYSIAGVMMRGRLSANSQHVSALFGPGTNNFGAAMIARGTPDAYAGKTGTSKALTQSSYWVRVVRSGNNFSTFSSPDGSNWTAIGQTTVAMPHTIYVGLAGDNQANTWFMGTVDYDNVTTTP